MPSSERRLHGSRPAPPRRFRAAILVVGVLIAVLPGGTVGAGGVRGSGIAGPPNGPLESSSPSPSRSPSPSPTWSTAPSPSTAASPSPSQVPQPEPSGVVHDPALPSAPPPEATADPSALPSPTSPPATPIGPLLPAPSTSGPLLPASTPINPDCRKSSDAIARADELMANGYRLGAWPLVTLPANPTWTENPVGDANWPFQLHSMGYVLDLFTATTLTGDLAYQDRALFLLQDWIHDNPRVGAPSIWSWNDHSTALRAIVLACAADLTPMTIWLHDALLLHGATLADPAFYRNEGNHALNQNIGLLEVARVLNRADWLALAGNRINSLILTSLDAEGVTNEQSAGYQLYNYKRYRVAATRMLEVGLTPGSGFARLDLMPEFLAQATIPNGRLEMIGDTSGNQFASVPGTVAEYAATAGAQGPRPTRTIAKYAAGYLFARTGWGGVRPATDETFLSVNWGAPAVFHGHADGLNLTLAAYGSRLLVDPGLYSYTSTPYRAFFKQHQSHNIVTVDGAAWSSKAAASLLGYRLSSRYVDLQLRASGYSGVTHTRRITYSRALDYIVVEDRLVSTTPHTYRQLWHLTEDAAPVIGSSSVWTKRAQGNVLIRQLAGAPTLRIVRGRTSPVQGWISYTYGVKVAAPVVEAIQQGTSVRYLTLIAPSRGGPAIKVSALTLTSTGYSVTITVGTRSEKLTVSGSSIWLH